jgi:hypothetical protein
MFTDVKSLYEALRASLHCEPGRNIYPCDSASEETRGILLDCIVLTIRYSIKREDFNLTVSKGLLREGTFELVKWIKLNIPYEDVDNYYKTMEVYNS